MGTTPNFDFPYPEPTDQVRNGATNFRELAEAVDAVVPIVTYGRETLTGAANVIRTHTITLPADKFPDTPSILLTPASGVSTSSGSAYSYWMSAPSATSFQISVLRGTTTDVTIFWQATYVDTEDPALLRVEASELTSVATCATVGCSNQGIGVPVDITWTDEDGVAHEVDSVTCGVCGQPITDITETS